MATLRNDTVVKNADGQHSSAIITAANIGSHSIAPNSTYYVGTTQNVFNRASGAQTLTGVSIDGNAANITAYTINQNVGTANAPSFAGVISSAVTGYAYLQVVDVNNFWITPGNVNWGLYFETAAGGLLGGTGDSNRLGFVGSGAARFYVDLNNGNGWFGGSLTANTDSRAPIFYDSNNTAYYCDPASTSVINRIDLPSGSAAINTTTPGTSAYQLNFTGQSTADYAQAITWGWSTSGAEAGIYVQSSGAYGTKMYIATTDSFVTGSKTAITIDHTGVVTTNRNYLQATGSLRAPIFYDSDNTAYYIDAASTSNLVGLTVANTITGSVSGSSASCTGNAATATILQTARNINGTSFNGSAAITTASWGTARTLTIGSTGKSVDGSAAVSWSLAELGAAATNQTMFIGTTSVAINRASASQTLTGVSIDGNAATATNGLTTSNYVSYSAFTGSVSSGGNITATSYIYTSTYLQTGGNLIYPSGYGATQRLEVSNSANNSWIDGLTIAPGGIVTAPYEMRSPIFYDSNDTTYYIDPASTSRVVALWVRGSSETIGNIYVGGTSAGNRLNINYDQIWTSTGHLYLQYSGAGNIDMNTGGGHAFSRTSLRAPIFYDFDNTAYYVDPASTSVLNKLTIDGGNYANNYFQSLSDFVNGTLVTTDIPASAANGLSFVMNVIGKSYNTATSPFDFNVQGYLYNSTIINYSGMSLDSTGLSTIKVFENGGFLCFWWARVSYWNAFEVSVRSYDAAKTNYNRVTNITDVVEPTGTKKVTVTLHRFMRADASATNSVDLRAPIFYDSNDTAYYTDPSSLSNILELKTNKNWYDSSASAWGGGINMGGNSPSIGFQSTSSTWWYMLHHSSSAINFYRRSTSGSWNHDGIWDSSGNFIWQGSSVRAPIFYDQNNTAYYLDPANSGTSLLVAGKVGIGTTSAISMLDVRGAHASGYGIINVVSTDSALIALDSTGARDHGIRLKYNGVDKWLVGMRDTNESYSFSNSSDTRLVTILQGGNVGIGTTSPATKLEVASTSDGILTLNKSSGTAWNYINFSQAGTRRFYFGLNASFEPELGVDNGGTFRVVGGMTVAGNAVLTSTSTLTAGNLSGTIPSGVLGNSTHYVGTTAIALNRASAGQTLTGISIDGNSGGIYAAGGAYIQTTSTGTSYGSHIQVREAAGGGGLTSEIYAPALGFHWSAVVASNILMESSGRIAIRDNPGTGYENFIANIVYGNASVRSPILYDSNDTAYYCDPAGESKLNYLRLTNSNALYFTTTSVAELNNEGNSTNVAFRMIKSGSSNADGNNYGVLNLQRTNHTNGATNAGGSIFFELKDSGGTIREYAGISGCKTEAGAAGGRLIFHRYARTEVGYWDADQLYSSSSVRSPIFYDSNDTGYYLNPAGSSQVVSIYANDWFRAQGNTGLYFQDKGYGITSAGGAGNSYGNASTYGTGLNGWQGWGIGSRHCMMSTGADNFGVHDNNRGWLYYWNGTYHNFQYGYLESASSVRAPLFYDSNNTTYYVDPASTGYSAYFAGAIQATKIGIEDAGLDCYMEITDANPTVYGVGYGGEFIFYGDKSTPASFLYYGGATVTYTLQANSSLRSPIFYDSNDTAYYIDAASGSNLNTVNANRFSAPNNGLISIGDDSATQTYNDGSTRSRLYVSSTYPAITLNSTVTSGNGNHGPTIQFTFNGYDSSRQWVIGSGGTGQQLDFGTAQPSNKNPHEGIAGYSGTTCMRMTVAGNVGIGGSWGYYGTVENPSYRMHVQGTGYASGDFRAPIFYDSNNTAYYLDPAAGTSLRIAGAIVGDHAAWTGEQNKIQWHSTHLYFQNTSDGYFIFRKSNGAEPFQLRISEEAGYATGSWRAPIFYDSNNTAYYVDPNSTSNLVGLTVANTITGSITGNAGGSSASCTGNSATTTLATKATRANGNFYIDDNYGNTVVGVYTSTRYQGVYAMGDSYKLVADGSTTGNLYGIAWSHQNAGGAAANLASHGLLILENGVFKGAWGGGSLRTPSDVRGTLFYDWDNTGYYCDPASTSNLNAITAAGSVTAANYYTGGWFRNNASGNGLYNEATGQHFYSDSGNYWNVASSASAQGIRLRTGGYPGTVRGYFYATDSNDVGFLNQDGNWRLRVVGGDYSLADGSSMRAQLFYDSNNTGYYVDPASTSNLAGLTVANTITGSITGSAGSVAWTNVSGRPTAVSSFSNDSGYITSGGSISGSSGSCTGNAASVTDGVYLSTNQYISGVKTFSSAPVATNIAKAWVHYNMNNNTINASYNVSSVTDNGTGVCTVNFSTSMVDANYVVAGTATYGYDDQDIYAMILAVPRRSTAQQAGSCRLATEFIHAAQVYDCVAVRAVFYR